MSVSKLLPIRFVNKGLNVLSKDLSFCKHKTIVVRVQTQRRNLYLNVYFVKATTLVGVCNTFTSYTPLFSSVSNKVVKGSNLAINFDAKLYMLKFSTKIAALCIMSLFSFANMFTFEWQQSIENNLDWFFKKFLLPLISIAYLTKKRFLLSLQVNLVVCINTSIATKVRFATISVLKLCCCNCRVVCICCRYLHLLINIYSFIYKYRRVANITLVNSHRFNC